MLCHFFFFLDVVSFCSETMSRSPMTLHKLEGHKLFQLLVTCTFTILL